MASRGTRTRERQPELVPAVLLADAIRAAHRRWLAAGDVTPFLFNFVDYLTVGLPPSTAIVVTDVETDARFSTADGKGDSARQLDGYGEPIAFHASPMCFRFKNRHLSSTGITERGCALLASLADVLGDSGNPSGKSISETLVAGVRAVFAPQSMAIGGQTKVRRSERQCLEERRLLCEEAAINRIVEETARNLAAAIAPGDEAYGFAIQIRVCQQQIKVIQYVRMTETKRAIPQFLALDPLWREDVQDAFQTGFLRLGLLPDGQTLLCIPCHFGGVPWIICCRAFKHDDNANWTAYTLYRDLNSRLSGAFRLLGQYSLAREMARLFRQTLTNGLSDFRTTQEAAGKAWANLPCIYPVPQPFLRPCAAEEEVDKLTLRIGASLWQIAFADDTSPCLDLKSALRSEGGDAWGTIHPDVIEMAFVAPVLSDLREQQIERHRDLARSAYAVGHPLKHRFRALYSYTDALSERLRSKSPHEDWDDRLAVMAERQVETCGRVADMLNFMATIVDCASPEQLNKAEFYSREVYDLTQHLPRLLAECNQSQMETVLQFEPGALESLYRVAIVPYMKGTAGKVRFFDALYHELFFELLLNAARHGLGKTCTISAAISPAETDEELGSLVLGNRLEYPLTLKRLNLSSEKGWTSVGAAWQGGLRFLADCLRLASAGSLEVRAEYERDEVRFFVRVCLRGLVVLPDCD